MTPIQNKNIRDAVILIKKLDNEQLIVIDANTTIRYLDINTLEVINGFKTKINHLRYKTDVVSASSNGKYFATLTGDAKEALLYSAATKKAVARVSRHQGEVSCVGIDSQNRYMFSCGDDGKTFATDIKSGKLTFTLPPHADTINAIAFSKNGNWVATVSYDKKVSLFNLSLMSPKNKFIGHSLPIMKAIFLSKNRLLTIDKGLGAVIWNIYSGKILTRLQGIHDDVTKLVTGVKDKFLFVGTSLGYILLYDLDTYKLLAKKYIKLQSTITALEFYEEKNQLLIGTAEGDLLFYNVYEGEDELRVLLKKKQYSEIQKRAEQNPVLTYTKIYDLVANLWEKTLEKARRCLEREDTETAMALFEDFKSIPAKNKIIQKVLREYADFGKFVAQAKKGNMPLAYGLANQHPMYKDSKIFKQLEARWQKAFVMAQKYALDPKGIDKAKEILAPYRGISEKTKLIQELLTQGEVYKRFRVALAQKEFRICFELIHHHPFLMEFPEYRMLMDYGDSLYFKAQTLIQKGETHQAIKLLRILEDFPDFKEDAKQLVIDIESKQEFFIAIRENDLVSAYNLLAVSEDLYETEAGQKLEQQWEEDLEKAREYAIEGDAMGVKNALSKYLKISSKYNSIATMFSLCYIVQLEQGIRKKLERKVLENGIKRYVLMFGIQEQIESFFQIFKKYYKDTKLNIEKLKQGSFEMWRPSMIVKSILEEK